MSGAPAASIFFQQPRNASCGGGALVDRFRTLNTLPACPLPNCALRVSRIIAVKTFSKPSPSHSRNKPENRQKSACNTPLNLES